MTVYHKTSAEKSLFDGGPLFSNNTEQGQPCGWPCSVLFGRLDEKKFCLLQVLLYKRVVNQTSKNCYKSLKSENIFMSTLFLPQGGEKRRQLLPALLPQNAAH